MSLDWSIRDVRDFEEITQTQKDQVITEVLVWGCLAVDMAGVTEKNRDEFYARMKAWEEKAGGLLSDGSETVPLTLEMVDRRIGLSTNVVTLKRKEWLDRAAQSKVERLQMELTVERTLEALRK
jgi:hypothetical protein